jgi:predicted RNA-binding Zn-ribbon protein involved in translation (DUF1610 family)
MSDFINCVGCGATIHKTAVACPKCGAPQKVVATAQSASAVVAAQQGYSAVPWFRRRWFVLLCLVTITPVASLLAMTGEVFYSSKGEVKQFPKSIRNGMLFAPVLWAMSVFGGGSSAALAAVGLIVYALILAFKK